MIKYHLVEIVTARVLPGGEVRPAVLFSSSGSDLGLERNPYTGTAQC